MKFKWIRPKKKYKAEWQISPGLPEIIKFEEGHRLVLRRKGQFNATENIYEFHCGSIITTFMCVEEALFNSINKCPGCEAWVRRI